MVQLIVEKLFKFIFRLSVTKTNISRPKAAGFFDNNDIPATPASPTPTIEDTASPSQDVDDRFKTLQIQNKGGYVILIILIKLRAISQSLLFKKFNDYELS